MRKLLWTALVAAGSTACAAAAVRALDWAWRKVAKEPPPDMPAWARFLVGKPLKKIARRSIDERTA
jgi:hypothetical protein